MRVSYCLFRLFERLYAAALLTTTLREQHTRRHGDTRAPPCKRNRRQAGFDLATDGIQFYVFCQLGKTSNRVLTTTTQTRAAPAISFHLMNDVFGPHLKSRSVNRRQQDFHAHAPEQSVYMTAPAGRATLLDGPPVPAVQPHRP